MSDDNGIYQLRVAPGQWTLVCEGEFNEPPIDERRPVLVQERDEPDRPLLRVATREG